MTKDFGDGQVYFDFSNKWASGPYGERIMPYDIAEWLSDKDAKWGTINGKRVGVFLNGEDASAFRLRFGL